MADETQNSSFLFSREELLLLLDLLDVAAIPGLDPDPMGELSDAQRALALIWAGRALRARGWATVGDDGDLLVEDKVLTAVSICALGEIILNVYHWPEPGQNVVRFFGCVRNGQAAAHTRPADVLHRVSILGSPAALVEKVTAVCQCQAIPDAPSLKIQLARDLFVQARELAEAQEAAAAQKTLTQNGVPQETAQAITAVLAGAPRMSIWQIVSRRENSDPQTYEYTLLQNDQTAWLISLPPVENMLRLETVTTTALKERLNQHLNPA